MMIVLNKLINEQLMMVHNNGLCNNELATVGSAIEKQQLDSERTIIIHIIFNNF